MKQGTAISDALPQIPSSRRAVVAAEPPAPLRIGLIGAGYMGSLHARKLVESGRKPPHLRLVGVVDRDLSRSEALGREYDVPSHTDHHALLSQLDAAVVAVPTIEHHGVVRDLLDAGVDVLVEKPIAATLEQAEDLRSLARVRSRVLQVGHLEWFNGAMQTIREHIQRPRFIEAHRMGPFPARATDIDVVRDLMIHDLDILQRILGEQPDRVEAVGVPVLTGKVDIANARLHFPSGCVANLTASRVSPTPMRKIRFFQRNGYFSVDFLGQSAVMANRKPGQEEGSPMQIEVEKLEVRRGDALSRQLEAFAHAVRTREKPAVDGEGGLDALRTALRVNEAMAPLDDEER